MTEKRTRCEGCRREWVFSKMHVDGDPCPFCGGVTERVTYRPAFVGADIDSATEARVEQARSMDVAPTPLVLA